jgi:hypothetical protein
MATFNLVPPNCQEFGRELASVQNAAANVNPAQVEDLVSDIMVEGVKGKKPSVWQMATEFTYNSLLSGLGTPLWNAVSGTFQTIIKPVLKGIQGVVFMDKAAAREARAMFSSLTDGWMKDFTYFNHAMKTGLPLDFRITPASLNMTQKEFNETFGGRIPTDVDGNLDPNIANEVLRESYDYITKAIPGRAGEWIRLPTRATVAVDEYFKNGLRVQKSLALLSRKASADEAKGLGSYDDLYNKYKTTFFASKKKGDINNALEETFGVDAQEIYDVRNYAKDNTYQTQMTGLLKMIEQAKGTGNTPLEFLITQSVLFVRTPWNLVKHGLSYVPGPGYFIRPGETKAILKYTEEGVLSSVSNEVVKMSKEEAVARQLVGLGAVTLIGGMASQGMITGSYPSDPSERARWQENGIPPFSIKVGDKWVSYQRADPISTVFGLTADFFEFMRYAKEQGYSLTGPKVSRDAYIDEAGKHFIQAMKANILQKTFMEGFADTLELMTNPTPGGLETYFEQLGQRVVPVMAKDVAKMADPYEREADGVLEKIQARIPGLRQMLPQKFGQYGAPKETPLVGLGLEIPAEAMEQTKKQKQMQKIGVAIAPPLRKLGNVELNSEQYSYLMERINTRTNQMLNRLDLEGLSNRPNQKMVRRALENSMKKIRKIAGLELQRQYPELREQIRDKKLFERGLLGEED